MFTGIIETVGTVLSTEKEGGNLRFHIRSALSHELRIDQSLSHNGACLTVVGVANDTHTVVAIAETLQRTNLGKLGVGSPVNLERALSLNARIDGHFVQGHIDQTAQCTHIHTQNGSWLFTFAYESLYEHLLIEKGSICIDGVSLTIVELNDYTHQFSVAIIPYTFEHTLFKTYKIGSIVNTEFDMLGKYITRWKKKYEYT